jgi:hypothetical protein
MQNVLPPEDAQLLIEYAKRKYAEERWPLSPSLRPIREALAKVARKEPLQGPKPYMPSMWARRKQRR